MASLDIQHYVGADDGEIVENVLEMMRTGYFHQRHPGYPGLLFYLHMVPAGVHWGLAVVRGEGDSLRELPREGFYRIARETSLLAGWAAAVLLYFVGRRFLSPWGSAWAASLLAFSPLLFRLSRDVSPDLMLMLFVVPALGLIFRALEEPSLRGFVVAGVGVGLSTAIKYTGAFTVFPFVAAGWLNRHGTIRFLLSGLLAAGAAFTLASPYTWIDLPRTVRGLTMHVGYYQAADRQAAFELLRVLATSGLGVLGAVAAGLGVVMFVVRREPYGLVLVALPVPYLLVFSFFGRAYPRHAAILLPVLALSAAATLELAHRRFGRRRAVTLGLAGLVLAPLIVESVTLSVAAGRPTPADRAAEWIRLNLPAGSRILEDQFTPRLDAERYRVHRLRVEESVFAGNYDWVVHSGYPPGLPLGGLRPVMRFGADGGLGRTITIYEVPARETLMPVTLSADARRAVLGAGELPFFGAGWSRAVPGAFGTSRLSSGDASEIFFVINTGDENAGEWPRALTAHLRAGAAFSETTPVAVSVELNGREVARFELQGGDRPREYVFELPAVTLRGGLNRLVLRYAATMRLDRRHPRTALRMFRLLLESEEM